MSESNTTRYSEWKKYVEHDGSLKQYKCKKCKSMTAFMVRRTVSEPTGGEHKEYKIFCPICQSKTAVHWRKTLTIMEWESDLN